MHHAHGSQEESSGLVSGRSKPEYDCSRRSSAPSILEGLSQVTFAEKLLSERPQSSREAQRIPPANKTDEKKKKKKKKEKKDKKDQHRIDGNSSHAIEQGSDDESPSTSQHPPSSSSSTCTDEGASPTGAKAQSRFQEDWRDLWDTKGTDQVVTAKKDPAPLDQLFGNNWNGGLGSGLKLEEVSSYIYCPNSACSF